MRKMVVGCTDGHSDPALIQAERDSSLDAKAKEVEKSGVGKGLRMTNATDADAQAAADAQAGVEAHAQAAADAGAPSRKTKVVADAAAAAAAAAAAEAAEAALLHAAGATPATGEGTWVLGDRPLSSASSDQVRQTPFWSRLYIKTFILPRQARDKHSESTQKKEWLCLVRPAQDQLREPQDIQVRKRSSFPLFILQMIGLTRQTRDRHRESSTQNPLLFRTVREYNGPRNCTTGALLTDEEVLRISDA
eukprot:COSAG06_NODE_5008_length_3794_cov_4.359946_6_plen_248_part_01